MQVEEIRDRANWTTCLSEMGGHDFAHTFDFHSIARNAGEGVPIAFVARCETGRAAGFWPVLKRPVPGSCDFDLTSVYGYAGPLVRDIAISEAAVSAILQRMSETGAISLFSRMHPLFSDRLAKAHRGSELGHVVVMPVDGGLDTMRGYRGSHRREIVNAARNGVEVHQQSGPAAIADFHRIYSEAMSDLDASQYYFFDQEYISSLCRSTDFRSIMLFASVDGLTIAGSIFTLTGEVMQYYLSGGLRSHRKLAPSKAIIAEAHRQAAGLGATKILLGGGLGSRQDALLTFKQGFSPDTARFSVTRKVFNQTRYIALCKARGVEADGGGHFPAYRAPAI